MDLKLAGDVETLVCDAQLAVSELNWHAKYDAVRI
jgi:UDP-glucose 4-epimerase